MSDLLKYKIQSVLVPKEQFKTEEEARQHVQRLGYDADYKAHPHETDRFYRFRQSAPNKTQDYRTLRNKEGDLIVYETKIGDQKILHKNKLDHLHNAFKEEHIDKAVEHMGNQQFQVLRKLMPEGVQQRIQARLLERKQHVNDWRFHKPVLPNQPNIQLMK